jgi:energy-coupling factor transporter transmembrane protein EcfT
MMTNFVLLLIQIFCSTVGVMAAIATKDYWNIVWSIGCSLWAFAWYRK